jgi:hypothetical protein
MHLSFVRHDATITLLNCKVNENAYRDTYIRRLVRLPAAMHWLVANNSNKCPPAMPACGAWQREGRGEAYHHSTAPLVRAQFESWRGVMRLVWDWEGRPAQLALGEEICQDDGSSARSCELRTRSNIPWSFRFKF